MRLSSGPEDLHGEKVTVDGERPRKRRRKSDCSPTCQQIALEEIDLEISMRQRIAETIQSRLAWAQLLQQSLLKKGSHNSDSFRAASLDALEAIEEPCNLIFNRESRIVSGQSQPQPVIPAPSASSHPDSIQSTRTSGRSTRTGGLVRAPPTPRKRLLFLRNATTSPPEIVKLACSVCSRSDFSNLQGLLNHCRLRHQLEYGSHDECVQSCAVLVPQEEQEQVIANGIELKGISLPSLRRLFEIAVGAGVDMKILPLPSKPPALSTKAETMDQLPPTPREAAVDNLSQSEAAEPGPHVTRTLGYHIDTPALAPFLGRAPKKRCINIRAEENCEVDIEDMSGGSGLHTTNAWRKPYAHRNIARKELDELVPLTDVPVNNVQRNHQVSHPDDGATKEKYPRLQMQSGTRFHIPVRVQVTDYSLFIPPNRRPHGRPDHTHRWRLAVTSPSYSLPISTVLSTLTITSVTDPLPSTLTEPIVIYEPPFVVTSTTDRPFLARLTFTWAGSMNPPTEIEHWVELDAMQRLSAVLGDEQVFDVELDRHTDLLPVRDVKEPSWDDEQDHVAEADENPLVEEDESDSDYAVKLRSLLPQYPMTLKDMRGRFSARVPYTLVSTPAHFRNLHYGRRKAIEMGRARALRDAYAKLTAQSQDVEALPLTTVDVFHWLEDEGLLLRSDSPTSLEAERPQKYTKSSRGPQQSEDPRCTHYCRTCGLLRAYHPTPAEDIKALNIKQPSTIIAPSLTSALRVTGSLCHVFCEEDEEFTRPPVINVDALVSYGPGPGRLGSVPCGFHSAIFTPRSSLPSLGPVSVHSADLVAVADPQLVITILRMTGLPISRSLQTHTAQTPTNADIPHEHQGREWDASHAALFPHTMTTASAVGALLTETRATVEMELGPSAALAIAMKAFIKQLVARGVETFREDEGAFRSGSMSGRHRHERARRGITSGGPHRLLTPAHVLTGVTRHSQSDIASSALLLSIARLGRFSQPMSDANATNGSTNIWRAMAARDVGESI